jgi:hypothetical protein
MEVSPQPLTYQNLEQNRYLQQHLDATKVYQEKNHHPLDFQIDPVPAMLHTHEDDSVTFVGDPHDLQEASQSVGNMIYMARGSIDIGASVD